MNSLPIHIATADGARHTFELVSIGGGHWGVNHPASNHVAGRVILGDTHWEAHVRDSLIPSNDGDTLYLGDLPDRMAAVKAVANEYGRRFLDTTPDPDAIPDDFEIKIPEGAEYHEDAFTIEQDDNGENRQYTHDEVKDMDVHHVWTVIDSDSDDGPYWAVPGFRIVNCDHYRVTAEPWKDEDAEKQYVA